MDYNETYQAIGHVDIYVIDQILKKRYLPNQKILDAGCGSGRNLKWFYQNDFKLSGIDADTNRIAHAKEIYPKIATELRVGQLDDLPYKEQSFDHIICCAVLHFAKDEKHFKTMFSEMVRVLKSSGTLLIRMASNIGLDGKNSNVQDGVSKQVGTYYLTRERIASLLIAFNLNLLEPIKTTNVQDFRAMTTLVLQKEEGDK